MAQQTAFGKPRDIAGKSGVFQSSLVPLQLLNQVRTQAIPFSNSGASYITVTVNASVSNPVFIWNGNDFISLKETLSYSWANSATNALIATTGATSSANTPGSTGVKYYYIGQASDGTIQMLPSTAKPSYVEGPYQTGTLGHPGTSRGRHWTYVGWNYMNATTPAFDKFVKVGYTYNLSEHAYAGVDTQPGEISMAAVPKHAGVYIGGFVTGAVGQGVCELGAATDATITNALVGVQQFDVGGNSAAATGIPYPQFDWIPVSSNGAYAHLSATATNVNVNVTRVHDVV